MGRVSQLETPVRNRYGPADFAVWLKTEMSETEGPMWMLGGERDAPRRQAKDPCMFRSGIEPSRARCPTMVLWSLSRPSVPTGHNGRKAVWMPGRYPVCDGLPFVLHAHARDECHDSPLDTRVLHARRSARSRPSAAYPTVPHPSL